MQETFTLGKIIEAHIPFVHLATPMDTVVSIFKQHGLSQISVIHNEQLVGVIYRKNLKRPFLKKSYSAQQVMTKNSIKFSIDDSVIDVAEILKTRIFDDIPVVDADNRFCGIVRWKSLATSMNHSKQVSYYS